MGKIQAIIDGIVVLALMYALGSWIQGLILAYQWITCISHM
jgi:hypothetical protein